METLSGTTLKDFSGNGNDLYCIDRNWAVNSTGSCAAKLSNTGSLWKSMLLTQDWVNISNVAKTYDNIVRNGSSLISYINWFSLSFLAREEVTTNTQSFLYHQNFWVHRNPGTQLSWIRSNTFSWDTLKVDEIRCSPHPLCVNNASFYKNYNYNPTTYNLHTITFNSVMRYYINGAIIYETPITKSVWVTNNSPLYVWGTTVAPTGLNGYIDDFKIYNRELSSEEVAQQARISWY